MSIKIAMLKSGEDVIADIKEITFREEDRVVGYQLNSPYTVNLYKKEQITLTEDTSENINYDIIFNPWAPLSQERQFTIPFDWVVTIYEPHDDVKSSYINKMEIINEHSSSTFAE